MNLNKIILVYGGEGSSSYIEMATVKDGIVGAYIPIQESILRKMRIHTKLDFFIFEKNILYYNEVSSVVVWTEPRGVRRMHFRFDNKDKTYEVSVPNMIFVLKGTRLSIYCTSNAKITLEIMLYHAPFYNTHEDGDVCMGSASKHVTDKFKPNELMRSYSNAFWSSVFSHSTHDIVSKNFKDMDDYTKYYLKNKRIDNSDLVPYTKLKNLEL